MKQTQIAVGSVRLPTQIISNEIADNPIEVFTSFFESYSVPEAQQLLWSMMKAAVCSSIADKSFDRENFMEFTAAAVELLEAANRFKEEWSAN